ncbi:MAG TPA: TerC family protein [Armatimonadetes bacterium]|nr:TerC family protein [Armatimonadota bacterium]
MSTDIWLWTGFILFVLTVLTLDLWVFHRRAHVVSLREAATWVAVWVSLALTFSIGVFHWRGTIAGWEFLTGYVIEWSLSMDNVFVFALVFSYFAVPPQYQHRVLFWGILGAIIMRGIFIFLGVTLLHYFHWLIYFFGGFLLFSGIKFVLHRGVEVHPERNPAVKLARRFLLLTPNYEGQRFITRQKGHLVATPLLLVLVTVEFTDLIFAVDSIPAILAITQDPFIVYTSNIFAILGLRMLYFLVAGLIRMFRYLKTGLGLLLCFVGAKMMLSGVYDIPVTWSLLVIVLLVGTPILVSLATDMKQARQPRSLPLQGSVGSSVGPEEGKE